MKYWALAVLTSTSLNAATLTVEVSNLQSNVGSLNCTIYDSKDSWLGDEYVSTQNIVIEQNLIDGVITATFELEPGDYAVSVHHDDNDNHKMDTNFIGIPKEPIGLSNGAVAKYGPPKYKDAVFSLGEEGEAISIKLVD